MSSDASPDQPLSKIQLRDAAQTLAGVSVPGNALTRRLEYVAELLSAAGPLPSLPLLVWKQEGGKASHAVIGHELCVGRRVDGPGVSLEQDAGLSRRHFVIRQADGGFELEDLQSRNGTAVNNPAQRIRRHSLRDGDIILAGHHTFVFLDQSRRL